MTKIVLPDPKEIGQGMSKKLHQEAKLIQQLMDLALSAGKIFSIQCRDENARKANHYLPKTEPEGIYMNTAWFGAKFSGGEFLRTETIQCRDAFVAWAIETLEWLKNQVKEASQDFKDMITIVVPAEICFTSGHRFTTV